MPATTKVTISDVANVAQVSKMSVSRVLNGQPGVSEETRLRILQAIESTGYVASPTPREVRRTFNIVGLILPDIASAYMGEVMRGVSLAAARLSYSLVLYTQSNTDHQRRTAYYASVLNRSLANGVLLVVPHDYEVLVNAFTEHNLPYVLIDHHSNTDDEPAITATNRKGVMDAMRHLMALGHKRIGFITGRMDMGCARDRLTGYRDALSEVGLQFDPDLVCEGDFMQPTGFAQTRVLLEKPSPPTAIFASNDLMAFGAMDAIKDSGLRVGADISVVGFDDIPMASQVHPPLTTVRQPMAQMGESALDLLVTLIEERTPISLRRELATELIVRESTARAPRS
jgi:LacI family transcriptional regulator